MEVKLPAMAAARLEAKLSTACAALSQSVLEQAMGRRTLPSQRAVPGIPPSASATILVASSNRAMARERRRYETVTSSPATGTRPAKKVTFPAPFRLQSTPSPATPMRRVWVAPPGSVLTTHAEPV